MSEITCTEHGFTVTITRSAGADDAVVIFVDGPEDSAERDLMPDGAPRCRILLNDEPVYAPVAHEYIEDGSAIEADPNAAQRRGL